jgi:putative membrane protein
MNALSLLLTAVVAVEHCGFFWLESIQWTKPLGLRVFAQSREAAASSAVLASNQGVYNLLLAVGLFASFACPPEAGWVLRVAFLVFVALAGAYGGWSAKPSIFFVQCLPALIALAATLASGRPIR